MNDRFVVINARGEVVREWDSTRQEWIFSPDYVHASDQRFIKECGITLPDPVSPDEKLKVVWEFWRATQSEYHRREMGVVDLGEIE